MVQESPRSGTDSEARPGSTGQAADETPGPISLLHRFDKLNRYDSRGQDFTELCRRTAALKFTMHSKLLGGCVGGGYFIIASAFFLISVVSFNGKALSGAVAERQCSHDWPLAFMFSKSTGSSENEMLRLRPNSLSCPLRPIMMLRPSMGKLALPLQSVSPVSLKTTRIPTRTIFRRTGWYLS